MESTDILTKHKKKYFAGVLKINTSKIKLERLMPAISYFVVSNKTILIKVCPE